jgi:predicted MFS family arabinose efflux permease
MNAQTTCGSWYAPTTDKAGTSRPGLKGCLSRGASLYLLGSITVSYLASSSAPTPLYPIYQGEWGFSLTAISFVFGVYAIAVLAALLVTGRLSDYIGRRPVLLVATAIQAATMFLFAFADGFFDLVAARVIQGLATGAGIAAVGAGMLDMDKARGAVANSVAPASGTALGAVAGGLMVHYLPAPTHLIYFVLAAIFAAQVAALLFVPELIPPRAGAIASLRPRFSLPAAARQPLLIAAPVLIAVWALAGLYASLGPSLVRTSFGLDSSLAGGIALFVLAGSAGTSVLLTQQLEARTLMIYGATVLLAGVALAVSSLSYHSAPAFFLGTVLAGSGFGTGFQGAIRTVVPLAAAQERGGVLSVIFVISYLAMGVPAVIAGYFVARSGDLFSTALGFGAVVMCLAALALIGTLRHTSHQRS